MKSASAIRAAFVAACRAELRALKPGSVHVHAGGHGMSVAEFETSAEAAAPWIAMPSLGVGARVLRAVEATLAAVGCNTNLGILLLAAPLAKAAAAESPVELRARLAQVLAALDLDDAAQVFRAIALANPAGLGTVPEQDVASPPTVDLRRAMALAADRDRIARAYVTDFADIFAFGLARLRDARRRAVREADAVTTLHMGFLAAFPDSHIARKHGAEAAREVRRSAQRLKPIWHPIAGPAAQPELLAFDADLKAHGLNPGTTADLVVNTLFADALAA